jgi:hypothetical protein
LSTCINKWCSGDQADITSAYKAYTGYCDGPADKVSAAGRSSTPTQGASPASSTGVVAPTSSFLSGSSSAAVSRDSSGGSPTSPSESG